jgi:surface protein
MINDLWYGLSDQEVQEPVFNIVFTDQPAPAEGTSTDVSEADDGGVIRWKDGKSYYFSTQRPGVKVTAPKDCYMLFAGITELKSVDVSMLDTSYTTEMEGVFSECKNLRDIRGLETWDVSKVYNMKKCFLTATASKILMLWQIGM